jgi:hypothetical protein
MMRITTNQTPRMLTFRLEGRLEGPWAALLEKWWRKTAAAGRRKAFRGDLSDVSFIDAAGRSVIAAMHRHGVGLTADAALTKALIDEITAAQSAWRNSAKASSKERVMDGPQRTPSAMRLAIRRANSEHQSGGSQMSRAFLNMAVRLTHDVPELWLHRGDVGVVQSIWLSPADCYEVEFQKPGQCRLRALLNAELLEVIEPASATATTGDNTKEVHMSEQLEQLVRLQAELHEINEELSEAARPLERLSELNEEQRKQLSDELRSRLGRWEMVTQQISQVLGANGAIARPEGVMR